MQNTTSRNKLAILAAMAVAAGGVGFGPQANDDRAVAWNDDRSDFEKFHDSYRARCREQWTTATPGRATRPHIGKKATRAVKRQRVEAMKAANHHRGHNEPFVFGQTYA